ncbi:MAG: hypothetical protein WDO70_12365 [Alphaproteobacteria bacterium]
MKRALITVIDDASIAPIKQGLRSIDLAERERAVAHIAQYGKYNEHVRAAGIRLASALHIVASDADGGIHYQIASAAKNLFQRSGAIANPEQRLDLLETLRDVSRAQAQVLTRQGYPSDPEERQSWDATFARAVYEGTVAQNLDALEQLIDPSKPSLHEWHSRFAAAASPRP